MNLLIVKPEDLQEDGVTFQATPEQSLHLHSVLHAKNGDSVKAGILGGNMGTAEILEDSKRAALLRFTSLSTPSPAKKKLRFVIALPRPQSFKKCLHFIASAGIPEVQFIQTARVEKSYWKSAALEPVQIEQELLLGLQQGVDTVLPEITFFQSFREWKAQPMLPGRRLLAHPVNALPCPVAAEEEIFAAIGPEGGFIPAEIDAFRELGFECVELGSYILRVEFALAYMTGRITP